MAQKITIALACVVVGLGVLQFWKSNRPADSIAPMVIVSITESGFSPAESTIRKGEAVKFVNDGAGESVWPASDLHPTHELYPEFDPREPLGPGESWTFVFERTGVWQMHDHLKSRSRGRIIVID